MIGRLITEKVLQGNASSINMDLLRIDRFASGDYLCQSHEHHIV